VVWNIHAAEVAAGISAVHDMAVGEDVGESTFLAELAVSLFGQSVIIHRLLQLSHLCEILAGRSLCQRLIGVQERTRLPSLTCALPVELAGHV
jgi:hypothetical protein